MPFVVVIGRCSHGMSNVQVFNILLCNIMLVAIIAAEK